MAFQAKKSGGGNSSDRVEQPLIEPDVYASYLVQMIDLGLQPQRPFKGKDKPPVQEIMLTYELSDCFMVDKDGKELKDKPRWVSETLPFYGLFADKAKSTQRYYAFDPNEKFDGDFAQAAGMACNVTIVNNVVGEKTYTNVANVAAISAKKAAAMEDLKNPVKVFDSDAPDMEIFNSLPDWIKDKIKANLNFKGSVLEAAIGGKAAPAPKAKAPKEEAPEEDSSDDNPY
jgi:hypothetical protein